MAYMAIPLLAIHVKQFVEGISPGGVDTLASFLQRWNASKWDIANMLETMPKDTAVLVRAYFAAHPVLKPWVIPNDTTQREENKRLSEVIAQIRTLLDSVP